MDTALEGLLSLSFILLCLAIFAITTVLRKIVEFVLDNPKVPASKTSKIWTDVFLPIAPYANGVLFGYLIKMYPYPDGFQSTGGRIVIGLAAGSLSGLVFKVVRGIISAKNEKSNNSV